MTTTVKIEAHLANTKEVKVIIEDTDDVLHKEEFTLQDGETADHYVYDGRVISVKEVEKSNE